VRTSIKAQRSALSSYLYCRRRAAPRARGRGLGRSPSLVLKIDVAKGLVLPFRHFLPSCAKNVICGRFLKRWLIIYFMAYRSYRKRKSYRKKKRYVRRKKAYYRRPKRRYVNRASKTVNYALARLKASIKLKNQVAYEKMKQIAMLGVEATPPGLQQQIKS
jgi:hypothetical protein